jgi:hypothetical protein
MELREYLATHAAVWRKPNLDAKGFSSFKYSTPVTPPQYLAFAEKDLRSSGPRGFVNALTNAKRAIDCSIFNLLSGIGLPEPYGFPSRLDLLQSLGLVAPRVIKKIVQLRNLLEHEYYLPKRAETEDALDIASLFVATLKPHFSGGTYMESAWLADEGSANPRGEFTRTATHTTWRHDSEPKFTYSRGIIIESEVGKKRIELSLVHDNVEVGTVQLAPKDQGFIELQGLLLRADLENFSFGKAGATKFLKALAHAAP